MTFCVAFLAFRIVAMADAGEFAAGDSFTGFTANDQHGKEFKFKAGDARFILFDTPGEDAPSAHPQDPGWFEKHGVLLIVNLSEFSAFKRKIAHSRLESKPFRVLVIEDKSDADKFPKQKEKFTVLLLDDTGKVTGVRFVSPGKELLDLVGAEKP